MASTINTNTPPPPAAAQASVQPPKVLPPKVETAKVDQTPREPAPAPVTKQLELAPSGSIGTKINVLAA